MKRVVIFDLDGTLLNSLDDLATGANYALSKNGYPKHPLSEYRYMVGNGIDKLLERALPKDDATPENVRNIKKDFIYYYGLHKTDFTTPYPGIMELLTALKDKEVLLAVASNKYHSATESLVKLYFGSDTFQWIYGQIEGVPVKPDPTIVENILRDSGISKEDTLFVGDSGVDMQTAVNSGVTAVGVTWGFRQRDELEKNGANHIVDTPEEILSLF